MNRLHIKYSRFNDVLRHILFAARMKWDVKCWLSEIGL